MGCAAVDSLSPLTSCLAAPPLTLRSSPLAAFIRIAKHTSRADSAVLRVSHPPTTTRSTTTITSKQKTSTLAEHTHTRTCLLCHCLYLKSTSEGQTSVISSTAFWCVRSPFTGLVPHPEAVGGCQVLTLAGRLYVGHAKEKLSKLSRTRIQMKIIWEAVDQVNRNKSCFSASACAAPCAEFEKL